MAAAKDERQSNFEQASTALNEGLETCRIVVGTYRELLIGDAKVNDRDGPLPIDENAPPTSEKR